jgi:hypothetical protein
VLPVVSVFPAPSTATESRWQGTWLSLLMGSKCPGAGALGSSADVVKDEGWR